MTDANSLEPSEWDGQERRLAGNYPHRVGVVLTRKYPRANKGTGSTTCPMTCPEGHEESSEVCAVLLGFPFSFAQHLDAGAID
jgi:hypothetical protein